MGYLRKVPGTRSIIRSFPGAPFSAAKERLRMFATPQLSQTEVFTEVPRALRNSSIIAERRPRTLPASVATL